MKVPDGSGFRVSIEVGVICHSVRRTVVYALL